MLFLRKNGMQQSSGNIILQNSAYDAVRKITVTPIQYMKKECMAVLNKKKVRLVNYETYMKNNDSSSGIYLTASKLAQCRLVA